MLKMDLTLLPQIKGSGSLTLGGGGYEPSLKIGKRYLVRKFVWLKITSTLLFF